ncbi:biosynthetic arginine decarboxylase [Tranquillimonas alkanivorans]|uniref:Arginine decarboxylase n=1 Tax=Tranquillimonas alkanivorans TaxID=441119 RepID=A0A1I5RDV8_9RHOB|nr:biosynthetic arginine decarboxylase [Tranquillimonas alkanivorans]SFP56645.1 arginine decarboxylase [Tranquillimonas alkanivorans]
MRDEIDGPHRVYGVERWGKGLVEVLETGDIGIRNPLSESTHAVSLPKVVEALGARGVQTPVLLRVASFLEHGVRRVNESFGDAIAEAGYRGAYRGVFPIKVNQQAQIVRRIVEYGQPFGFGLEAGSKPELVIALSQPLPHDALIVCNGTKDEEFVRLAILSRKLGFNTVIVLESLNEVEIAIRVAGELDVDPLLGVRVKLTNQIGGAWAASSGDRSAFGLNSEQLVTSVDRLKEAGLLHCLKLQHSHLGSQIPDVNDVRRAATEACRYFTELLAEGVPLTHLDLGGGLGVDYTGEMKATESSVNYSVKEYCASIVETVRYAMDEAGVEHPTLVTESGRAVVAMSSVLVFDVLEATLFDVETAPAPEPDDHHLVADLAGIGDYVVEGRLQECVNDASYYRNELRALFRRGTIGLRQVARGERIYLRLMSRIRRLAEETGGSPDLVAQLESTADILHCNFSLFQSLPDVWAIDQLHPLVPLQRLNEVPDRRAILSDITCDSDGKIDRFILADRVSATLPVHDIRPDERYLFGTFFVGAYQETLGDLHNLFGDTNVATIELRENGEFDLIEEVEGDTIGEVLSYVEYNPRDCMDGFRRAVDRAISNRKLDASEGRQLIEAYRSSINGYTYYE